MDQVFVDKCQTVIVLSEDAGKGPMCLSYIKKCYQLLKEFLDQNSLNYTPDIGLEWLKSLPSDMKRHGYKEALEKLNAAYRSTDSLTITTGRNYSFYNDLDPYWRSVADCFLDPLRFEGVNDKSLQRRKLGIAHFLHYFQRKGLRDISQIDYSLLKDYSSDDNHRNRATKVSHFGVAGEFLLSFAHEDTWLHGMGLYMQYLCEGKNLTYSAENEIIFTEQYQNLPKNPEAVYAKDLAAHIEGFLDELVGYGYSQTVMRVSRFTLGQMLVFLDSHGFAYYPEIIQIWFDFCFTRVDATTPTYRQRRRILCMFERYMNGEGLRPDEITLYKSFGFETLPEWCREEISAYLEYKKREGKEQSSIKSFQSSLSRFCRFLVDNNVTSFSSLTPQVLKAFNMADKHETNMGKNTCNGRIRNFLKYLEIKGIIQNCFLHEALLPANTQGEKIVIVLTEQEKQELAAKHALASTPIELRDRAINLLGLELGLRGIDAVTMELSDIDWAKSEIRVMQEKTDFEIRLPMSVELGNALYLYITLGRPKSTSNLVFLKTYAPFSGMTKNAAIKALHRTLPDRSVPKSGFHVFRKTFATDKLNEGIEPSTIADMIGQQGQGQLHRYLSLDEEKMVKCPLSLKYLDILPEMKNE